MDGKSKNKLAIEKMADTAKIVEEAINNAQMNLAGAKARKRAVERACNTPTDYTLYHRQKLAEPGVVPMPSCRDMEIITKVQALENAKRTAKDIVRQVIELGKDSIKFLKEHKKALKDYYKFLEKYDHTF